MYMQWILLFFKMSFQHGVFASLSIIFRACERKVNYKLSAVCIPFAARKTDTSRKHCVGISITSLPIQNLHITQLRVHLLVLY